MITFNPNISCPTYSCPSQEIVLNRNSSITSVAIRSIDTLSIKSSENRKELIKLRIRLIMQLLKNAIHQLQKLILVILIIIELFFLKVPLDVLTLILDELIIELKKDEELALFENKLLSFLINLEFIPAR